jgi:ADP-ribose pyrophosphatase YjhB (NUDIX family)
MYSNGLKYSDVKRDLSMENSQFTFHLDALIKHGYIHKEDSFYTLTAAGKEFANRMDIKTKEFKPFPKTTAMLCATRTNNGIREVLLYTRQKTPFYGCQGFPTQKVLFGDSIIEVAKKGLLDETGLIGNPQIKAIRHYRVYQEGKDEVQEDKIMYMFLFENPEGELINSEEGDYYWVDITKVDEEVIRPQPEFHEAFGIIAGNADYEFFREDKHITDKF